METPPLDDQGFRVWYEARRTMYRSATLAPEANSVGSNGFWNAFSEVLTRLTTDIGAAGSDDMLRECFTRVYDGNITYTRYLGAIPSEWGLQPATDNMRYLAQPFFLDTYLRAQAWNPNTILLGLDVGYGKTTLLKYYFRIWLCEEVKDLPMPVSVVWVDCMNAPPKKTAVRQWLVEKMLVSRL